MKRYFRISEAEEQGCPFKASRLYKMHHLQEFPQIFVKVQSTLLVDRQAIDELLEQHRQTNEKKRAKK
ncbi:MAG: hypothetical protein ACLQVJ_29695 [Syntrophobacteraceae bacterium]